MQELNQGLRMQQMERFPVRALFISDIHLGTRGAKANELLSLLSKYEFEMLYIVGDLIDLWQINARRMNWRRSHTKLVERLVSISKQKPVYYVIGNHDEEFRSFVPLDLFNLHFVNKRVHRTLKGENLLVFHGDIVDIYMRKNYRLLSNIGGRFYDLLLGFSWLMNRTRAALNKPYWSLSNYIKTHTKNISRIVQRFENSIVRYAKQRQFSHVLCGHVHHPDIREINGIQYMNTGDWVENCSAIIEDLEGNFSIVREEIQIGRPAEGDVESEAAGRQKSRAEKRPDILSSLILLISQLSS